ncbi:MAG: 30S ribosomal protein S6 [Clostridia bacterium]|nr:30S ribosomal protein S6 [Clostridia bacterium]
MMNKYESVIIINPNIEEAGLKALEEKFTGLINENGKVESVENMGKKRLAYEIKKNKEGIYMLFNFEANPDSIAELERVYRITDDIIKFIVVRKDVA